MHSIVFKTPNNYESLRIESENIGTLQRLFFAALNTWDLELGGDGKQVAKNYWANIGVASWRVGTLRQFELSDLGWVTFIRNVDEDTP